MKNISVTKFRTSMSDTITAVAKQQRKFMISRYNKPRFVLMPIEQYESMSEAVKDDVSVHFRSAIRNSRIK